MAYLRPLQLDRWPTNTPVAVYAWGSAPRVVLPGFALNGVMLDDPGDLALFINRALPEKARASATMCL